MQACSQKKVLEDLKTGTVFPFRMLTAKKHLPYSWTPLLVLKGSTILFEKYLIIHEFDTNDFQTHEIPFFQEKVPKLEPLRIPMNQEQAPAEANFDQIVAMLKDTTASCPVIFNCQVWDQIEWFNFVF